MGGSCEHLKTISHHHQFAFWPAVLHVCHIYPYLSICTFSVNLCLYMKGNQESSPFLLFKFPSSSKNITLKILLFYSKYLTERTKERSEYGLETGVFIDSLELECFCCVVCNKILFGQSQRINLQLRHNYVNGGFFFSFFSVSNSEKKIVLLVESSFVALEYLFPKELEN